MEKQIIDESKIGQKFRWKRGRKIYTLSALKYGFIAVYHDAAGIESSVDLQLFPDYLKRVIWI